MKQWTDMQDIWNYLELICKHCRNIPRKFEIDCSSRKRDITDNLISVREWGNEQTERHTTSLKLFETTAQTSPEFEKESSSKTGDINDISCSGKAIFLKFSGGILGMFVH